MEDTTEDGTVFREAAERCPVLKVELTLFSRPAKVDCDLNETLGIGSRCDPSTAAKQSNRKTPPPQPHGHRWQSITTATLRIADLNIEAFLNFQMSTRQHLFDRHGNATPALYVFQRGQQHHRPTIPC